MATAAPTSQFAGVDFLQPRLPPLRGGARGPRHRARLGGREPHPGHRRGVHRGAASRSSSSRAWPSWGSSAPTCRRSTAAPGSTTWRTGSSCRSWSGATRGIRSFASVQGALVMYPDLRLRLRRAEEEVAAAAGVGAGDRLLRADRAGLRLQPRRHDHHRAGDQGRLGAQRHQDVDHQRLAGHGRRSSGPRPGDIEDPKSIRGFIVPTDTKGYTAQGPEGEALAAAPATPARSISRTSICRRTRSCPSRAGSRARSCASPRRATASPGAAIGAAMACYDEALRYAQQRVMFDRPIAADADPAGAAGRHADRDHQGAVHDPPARPAQGRGHHDAGAGVAVQAEQREHRLRHRARGPPAARRATASWPSITRCGTWPTWSRSTPTRAPTTCTR